MLEVMRQFQERNAVFGWDRIHRIQTRQATHVSWEDGDLRDVDQIPGLQYWSAPGVCDSDSKEHRVIVTDVGNGIFTRDQTLFHYLNINPKDIPGISKYEYSGNNKVYCFIQNSTGYFIKRYKSGSISAAMEIAGMQLLSNEGVHTCQVIAATATKILTQEAPGERVSSIHNELLIEYRKSLRRVHRWLVKRHLWIDDDSVGLDIYNEDLRVRDIESNNSLDWFTIIDAIRV